MTQQPGDEEIVRQPGFAPSAHGEEQPEAEDQRRSRALIWGVVTGIAILALVAAGVTLALLRPWETPTQPGQSTSPPESTTPSPSETSEPLPAAIVIPGCEAMSPSAKSMNDFLKAEHPEFEQTFPPGEVGREVFDLNAGPAARAAMDKVQQTRICNYVFSPETGINYAASELLQADQAPLVTALEGDSDFVKSTLPGAQIYTWAQDHGDMGTSLTVHMFMGDVWVAFFTVAEPADHLNEIHAALVAANPQLAG